MAWNFIYGNILRTGWKCGITQYKLNNSYATLFLRHPYNKKQEYYIHDLRLVWH